LQYIHKTTFEENIYHTIFKCSISPHRTMLFMAEVKIKTLKQYLHVLKESVAQLHINPQPGLTCACIILY